MKFISHLLIFSMLLMVSLSFAHEKLTFKSSPGVLSKLPNSLSVVTAIKSAAGLSEKTINIEIPVEEGKIFDTEEQYKRVIYDGFDLSGTENDPALPVKTFRYDFPGKVEFKTIVLLDVSYMLPDNKVLVAPYPKNVRWDGSETDKLVFKENPAGYSVDGYSPGKIFTYTSSYQNKQSTLYLTVKPVQYNPVTKQLLIIKSYKLKALYKTLPAPYSTKAPELDTIILTSKKLQNSAEELKAYHLSLGYKSAIYTVEAIAENFEPIEETNLPPGYKDNSYLNNNVKKWNEEVQEGYNYVLAKRIIKFFDKITESKKLKYITILGNAQMVPPSYYFTHDGELVATDYFYASSDVEKGLDYFAETVAGRLPVKNDEEALSIINKYKKWDKAKTDGTWFSNVTLVGGVGMPQKAYVGETSVLHAIEKAGANWQSVSKLFFTEGLYEKKNIHDAMANGAESGIFYHVDHGAGDKLYIQRDGVSSSEILAMPEKTKIPFVFSVSCLNGLWDGVLLKNKPFDSEHSVGESILLSKGAGLGYFGGDRNNYGLPVYFFDDFGNLKVSRVNYTMELLDEVIESYMLATTASPVGEFYRSALNRFTKENSNDFKDQVNLRALYSFSFLGDPALIIPARKKGNQLNSYASSETKMELDSSGYRIFKANEKSINFNFPDKKEIMVKLYKVQGYSMNASKLDEQKLSISESGKYVYKMPEMISEDALGNSFLIKTVLPDGSALKNEARLHFIVK